MCCYRVTDNRVSITAINNRPDASAVEGDISYVLFPTIDGLETEWVGGNPVLPLGETVKQMMENRSAYESALEIIADQYDVDIDASHHDQMRAD